ncbi:MAG: bifunctional glutamate N-acetyltransferase/amino-acid acetyltransferase ArgJ [Anaerolineaceae bacterium]|nr:bifunctional glutamate N-acetyltransferase/amino-acid acetyltransferase ArgJ [Anaerolineaceae bacterium]
MEYVNSLQGFRLAAVHSGLKSDQQKDLVLIVSDNPCQIEAIFTTNQVKAAPVLYDQNLIASKTPIQAIVLNAGNANACTGKIGMDHVEIMANAVCESIGLENSKALVMSTGVIGVPLSIDKVLAGIEDAGNKLTETQWSEAAFAIMTTDTYPKIISVNNPAGYSIMGIAKGAGMISPDMATMLSVICTDAKLSDSLMNEVSEIWDKSFNRIVVDGDMSTNDSVVLMANGASGVVLGHESDFIQELTSICEYLAKAIVADGEGATKLVTVSVNGAKCEEDAEKICRAIATSPLCKTAFYGADPNWGRFICAAGYSGVEFETNEITLWLTKGNKKIKLFENGMGANYLESEAQELMLEDEWGVEFDLGEGIGNYWLWTCDLSHEYITINGHYRT